MKLFWWSQYKEMQQQAKMILVIGRSSNEVIQGILSLYECGGYTKNEAEKEIFSYLYEITEPENRSK